MKQIEYLKNLIQNFLDGELETSDFGLQFENYFFDHEEEIYESNRDIHSLFDNIREAIAYFQPDPKIREEYDYLLNEEQLREVVGEQSNHISSK